MEEKRRTKAEYRSSLRSKRLIREALITLMRSKPFEKITITDIVRTADINRGTFYAHFRDTEEVLSSIKEIAITDLKEAFTGLSPDVVLANPRMLFEALSAMLEKDSEYYRLLLSVEEFRKNVMEHRFDIIDKYLMKTTAFQHLATDTVKRAELVGTLDFLVAGILDVYADVLCDAVPVSLSDLPELLTRITGGAIRQITELVR